MTYKYKKETHLYHQLSYRIYKNSKNNDLTQRYSMNYSTFPF